MNAHRTRFEAKVSHRRKTATWYAVGYFALIAAAAVLVGILLIFQVALGMGADKLLVVSGVFGLFVVLAFMAGWNSQRNFKASIDTWLADADEIEKLVISSAIQDDHQKLLQMENTIDVTGSAP